MPPGRFSHSSLASWRRCRYQYWLKYIKNYISPPGKGQQKGLVGHAALAEWYRTDMDDEKAMKVASEAITNIELESGLELSEAWDELSIVLTRYFNWARANDRFEIVRTKEGKPSIELEYEIEIDGMKLMGYIDGVVQKGNYTYVLEHKFVQRAEVNHIDLDMQVSIYMLAGHKLGYNPYGTFYNVIRMGGKTDKSIAAREPVLRGLTYRNAEGLAVVEYELGNQMREVTKFNKEGGLVYRSPTKDCSWDCSFYQVCLSLNDNGDADSVLRTFQIKEYPEDKGVVQDDTDTE
jgi:hypothetical protein